MHINTVRCKYSLDQYTQAGCKALVPTPLSLTVKSHFMPIGETNSSEYYSIPSGLTEIFYYYANVIEMLVVDYTLQVNM